MPSSLVRCRITARRSLSVQQRQAALVGPVEDQPEGGLLRVVEPRAPWTAGSARTGDRRPDRHRAALPAQREELDREGRRRPVVTGLPGPRLRSRALLLAGPSSPDRSPLTSAISTGTPASDSCSAMHLQRLGLAGTGRAGDQAVPVQHRQRDAHPGRRVDLDRRRRSVPSSSAATLDRVPGGDPPGRLPPVALVSSATTAGRVANRLRRVNDRLVWIDCEMTGLDLRARRAHRDRRAGHRRRPERPRRRRRLVIHADEPLLAGMPDVVRDMHARSGLTEEVRRSTVTLREAEERVLDYIREHVPDPRTAPLAGNSIATDRGFITRDMPELDAHLHYRMVDVSSIKELCRRWYPRVFFAQAGEGHGPPRAGRHHASRSASSPTTGGRCSWPRPARRARRPTPSAASLADPPGRATATRHGRLNSSPAPAGDAMVGVAQLVEHLVVVQDVAGSSPVTHPAGTPPPGTNGTADSVLVAPSGGAQDERR